MNEAPTPTAEQGGAPTYALRGELRTECLEGAAGSGMAVASRSIVHCAPMTRRWQPAHCVGTGWPAAGNFEEPAIQATPPN